MAIYLAASLLILLLVNTHVRSIVDSTQDRMFEDKVITLKNDILRQYENFQLSTGPEGNIKDFQIIILSNFRKKYFAGGMTDTAKPFPFILDESGRIVIHPRLPRGDTALKPLFSSQNISSQNGKVEYVDTSDNENWAFYANLPEWKWILCWSVPDTVKYADFEELRDSLIRIVAGSFLIMGLALALILSRMLKPVSKLTNIANAIASGDMDQHIEVTSSDEIGTLSLAFIHMQEALDEKMTLLRKSNAKYRGLIHYANSVILRWDKAGRVIFLNEFGQRLFGFRLEEIIGKHVVGTIVAKKDSTGRDLSAMIDDILRQPKLYPLYENENVCRSGKRVWIQWSNNAIVDEQGNFVEMLSVGIDITELKEAEKQLREAENRYRALFASANDAILIRRSDGICIDCNQKALELFGCERYQIVGHPPDILTPPVQPDGSNSFEKAGKLIKKALAGEPITVEWQIKRADGSLRDVISNINSFKANSKQYVQSVLKDITRQKRIESELRQAQKMEGIGTLAGGIAHDFNNILSAIIGYTELAQMKAEPESELGKDLLQVRMASERARGLVRQILTFSRKKQQEQVVLQVNLVVKEALKLIRSSIPSTIEITQDIATQAAVLTDPTHIHQLIMNLCTNAYQAMEKTGGKLHVSMHEILVSNDPKSTYIDLPAGSYVHIAVKDTGYGMDEETISKIFDPFFTTKAQDRGTGLGLAVVNDIVQGLNGTITIQSTLGKGSIFNVYLPVVQDITLDSHPSSELITPISGSERIMVVDDEEAIRYLVKKILVPNGYQVDLFQDGSEAWQAFKRDPRKWSLVVTDQTMPIMTGEELATKVMELSPDLPVILCTGYSESISVDKALSLGIKAYLHKPIAMNELLASVHRVLVPKRNKTE